MSDNAREKERKETPVSSMKAPNAIAVSVENKDQNVLDNHEIHSNIIYMENSLFPHLQPFVCITLGRNKSVILRLLILSSICKKNNEIASWENSRAHTALYRAMSILYFMKRDDVIKLMRD